MFGCFLFYSKSFLKKKNKQAWNCLDNLKNNTTCVKSVQIQSYFWSIFSCIQSEYRKIRTRNTPYLDTFHAVQVLKSCYWTKTWVLRCHTPTHKRKKRRWKSRIIFSRLRCILGTPNLTRIIKTNIEYLLHLKSKIKVDELSSFKSYNKKESTFWENIRGAIQKFPRTYQQQKDIHTKGW